MRRNGLAQHRSPPSSLGLRKIRSLEEAENENLQIHHVVCDLQNFGGPSYTVPSLCAQLASLGNDVVLHALPPAPDSSHDGFELKVHPRMAFPAVLGISGALKSSLREAAQRAAFLHSHGLWAMPNIYPARCLRGTTCRLVVSPRGTLDRWALRHHAWRKNILWRLGQRANLLAASCLHATADQEYGFFRELGLTAPVALIPNGVDIPPPRPEASSDDPGIKRLLFLARIHPKKGVDILLRAWRNVQERFSDWELLIVGPDDGGHLPKMQQLSASLGAKRVTFTGWIPETQKAASLYGAHIFILPTHGENWGVSVAEALAHGLPAIVSTGAPWSGLETHRCGWWIDNSVEAVTECLSSALALSPGELRSRGARGRAWMSEEFPWPKVGRMMHETYRWMLEGGTPPAWVRLN